MATETVGSALTVKPEYLCLILCGKKRWELRTKPCRLKGTVALVASGTSMVWGLCDIAGCRFHTLPDLQTHFAKHCLAAEVLQSFAREGAYAWRLRRPRILAKPLWIDRARGSVSWVRLATSTKTKLSQLRPRQLTPATQATQATQASLLAAMRTAAAAQRMQRMQRSRTRAVRAVRWTVPEVSLASQKFVGKLISEASDFYEATLAQRALQVASCAEESTRDCGVSCAIFCRSVAWVTFAPKQLSKASIPKLATRLLTAVLSLCFQQKLAPVAPWEMSIAMALVERCCSDPRRRSDPKRDSELLRLAKGLRLRSQAALRAT
ncbi:MSH4, partial [Symbiodinium pilosum]